MKTIKDFFNKNYDTVEVRMTVPKECGVKDIFAGLFQIHDGQIISLDGDYYDEDQEVLSFEEWTDDSTESGLTIVIKGTE